MNNRVCTVAYTFYESDNRVRRYAETLVAQGFSVDVFALKQKGTPSLSQLNGVTVRRIQEREVNEKGKFSYLYRILKFLLLSTLAISRAHRKVPYKLVHVHSIPDFQVFSAILPKLNGAAVILDIHDLVPEFYISKFEAVRNGILHRILIFAEQISAAFSNHVIISNHLWYHTVTSRSVNQAKCSTIMNYPDQKFFRQKPIKRNDRKLVIFYPGSLNWHQGLDIAIDAFALIHIEFPEAELHIQGEGPEKNSLKQQVINLGLEKKVFFRERVSSEEIVKRMASADIGIVPKRNDPFGGEAFSTKTLEFMALGIPIVLSKTKIDQFYFTDKIVKFFQPEDVNDLAQAISSLLADSRLRTQLSQKASEFVSKNNWEVKKEEYLKLVNDLINR